MLPVLDLLLPTAITDNGNSMLDLLELATCTG